MRYSVHDEVFSPLKEQRCIVDYLDGWRAKVIIYQATSLEYTHPISKSNFQQ